MRMSGALNRRTDCPSTHVAKIEHGIVKDWSEMEKAWFRYRIGQ